MVTQNLPVSAHPLGERDTKLIMSLERRISDGIHYH